MDGSVILPLYVYPSVGAWNPIFEVASSHPGVQFTAIINPQDGPGEATLPEENYLQAIETLNSFDNVRTIGYVATTWFTKNLSSVLDEIDTYSHWAERDSSLAMSGIFLDEIPTHYTPENVSYLQAITQAIHDSSGLRDSYIVHNPGALPEGRYFDDPTFTESADLTIVFEDTFSSWSNHGTKLTEATKSYDRSKLALMLHSLPRLNYSDTKTTLRQLLAVGQSLWLTETKNYTELDSYLPVFIDTLDRLIS